MAEGNWWSSWVNTAKTKSAEVYEFVKKDIDEISTVVKNEATVIANHAAEAVKDSLQLDNEDSTANTVKKSLSSFFDQITEVFVPPSEDDQVYVPVVVKDGEPVQLSPFQAKYYKMISSDETFTKEIEIDLTERFDAWLSVAEESLTNVERLTNCLATNPILQDKYTQLVPEMISHSEFWKRYMFRKALLEDEEAERERKEKRVEPEQEIESVPIVQSVPSVQSVQTVQTVQEQTDDSELTEEEQIRLLAQYEEEIKNSELKTRDKKDLVIVGVSGQSLSSKESSTDGEWEKEFEIEEDKN